ncbi:MAG: hypothetical protein HZC28_06965 [Spirochaetes bacterium]|nr:hypothetical protein [Spirochaetota bacterium]
MRFSIFIALAAVLMLVSGCDKTAAADKGKWIAKIDNSTVFEKDFDAFLAVTLESSGVPRDQIAMYKNNASIKQKVLDDYISKFLIVRKAEADKFFDTRDAKEFMALAMQNIKFEYYIRKKMLEYIPEATTQEIDFYYQQQKAALEKQYGIRTLDDKVRAQLANLIKMQRVQKKLAQVTDDLKSSAVIKRNKEAIGEPNIEFSTQDPNAAIPTPAPR